MKTRLTSVFILIPAAAAALFSVNASAVEITGRVISSTPVVEQIAVPRQVCSGQTVTTEAPKSGAGFALGALAGGAAGNAIGNGSGRAVATFIGLIGGGLLGNQIEGSRQQTQNVQQCSTQTFYENRASYYNVVYDYQGTQYTVQMPQDPGPTIKLQVTPVGTIQNQQNQVGPQTQPIRPQVNLQPQEQTVQPQAYQPITVTPMYVQQQQPVFVAPVVVQSSSSYYGQPYYAPVYQQRVVPNVSLNFGYSRGYGHGGGHGHGYRY
jgi:uncharacterized protein YcfJ